MYNRFEQMQSHLREGEVLIWSTHDRNGAPYENAGDAMADGDVRTDQHDDTAQMKEWAARNFMKPVTGATVYLIGPHCKNPVEMTYSSPGVNNAKAA